MTVQFRLLQCLSDNFCLLAHDPRTGSTICFDAPDADPIAAALDAQGWRLSEIALTHHHQDHIGGVAALKARFPAARVIGAGKDAHRLPPLDLAVTEGDEIPFGRGVARVLETPGHTLGHIVFHLADEAAVVTGDTLFSLGCGRVMEGTMPMMFASLQRLAALPAETAVYCGHEYTLANARFAATVEPDNPALLERLAEAERLRARGAVTIPTTIGRERATNPFFRTDDPKLRKILGLEDADDVEVFTELRERKNHF
ncbi:hydroxyacylglutathione hydrolase [Rhodoblastus acidophilus]|uniref:Hydroxyacylglutathione hydrolase n=1 Tax=Rhodoblastus acidophilus TaxID=1074 RepID=A0A212SBA1_RHOAC|nr:hydroxyacylglutathione hydrolase [Rhodoblastus acidophilus]PPQ35667.1 hydroxyacylglutathione hydrolase [Rhodoblastus acidophilus]RAI17526.1 hydroxyacylglutathione hydrolase [Rhodoblastus acidophilus]SNB82793.1 hydroxyacylglutathione hydrolase [Rhodoblastus acidophilus]